MRYVLFSVSVLLPGCQEPCGAALSVDENSAHHAALIWHAQPSDAVRMVYQTIGDPEPVEVPVQSTGISHVAEMWGLPALSEVLYSFTDDASGQTCSGAFQTGSLEPGLPALDVTLNYSDSDSSWRYLAGVAMGSPGMLFVLDRRGALRWHALHDESINSSAVAVSDNTFFYNTFDLDRSNDISRINAVALNSDSSEGSIRTEGAHHTFTLLPDGAVAFPSVDVRSIPHPDTGEPVDVVGDRLLEMAPDGTVTQLWSVWDHESPSLEPGQHNFYGSLGHDWSHANGLSYSEARDSYLLSLGHLDIIYEIDRKSGAVRQRLSSSDVTEGHPFRFQHDPNWTDTGTLLLLSYPENGPPVVAEYAVEDGAMTEVWSYTRDTGGISLLGQARRLPGGNTLVNFGGVGEIQEVTPDGRPVWQLNAGLGSWFGNLQRLDTLH